MTAALPPVRAFGWQQPAPAVPRTWRPCSRAAPSAYARSLLDGEVWRRAELLRGHLGAAGPGRVRRPQPALRRRVTVPAQAAGGSGWRRGPLCHARLPGEPRRRRCRPAACSRPSLVRRSHTKPHVPQVICWVRSKVILHLLKQGYAVHNSGAASSVSAMPGALAPAAHMLACARSRRGPDARCLADAADSDVVYSMKPVWPSYLAFIEAGHADGAFQARPHRAGGAERGLRPLTDHN